MALIPTLIWTVLPNGVTASGYKLSLFVSPRLDAGGSKLGDYDPANFPDAILAMAANKTAWVQLNTTASPLLPVTIDTSSLRPDLWAAIFPPATPVTGFSFKDNANRPLYSYSVAALENYLENLYETIGNQSATQFPDLKTGRLRQLADEIGRALPLMREGLRRKQPGRGPHPDAPIEAALDALGSPVPVKEFYRALRFYKRGNNENWAAMGYKSQQDPVDPSLVPEPLKPPPFDFHQAVALLGDHPFLLRALGLVIDCTLSFADLGGSLPANGCLRAQVQWGPAFPAPSDKTPWTRFEVDATGFRPEPRKNGDIQAGLLTLGNADRFKVFQTDVDGNALKTLDYAVNMKSVLTQLLAIPPGENAPWVPVAQPAPESLPAQRNGGLTLTRLARDEKIHFDFSNQSAINGSLAGELYFDDIARGYRVDVNYNGKWHSLCQRTGGYKFAGAPLPATPPPDEGYVKAASGTSGPKNKPNPDNPLYLHEAVFGWDNWSLVAPRPGRSITFKRNDTARTQTLDVERVENKPTSDFPLVPEFSVVNGSLPRLRFGQFYQFRARVVDLAGNGLPAQTGDFPGTFWRTPRIQYLRYEPVPPPVFVLRERVTAGESVEHLVIRTKVTSDDLPDQDTVFNDVCRRFIAPPKTSQILAELHGAFDPFWSDPVNSYQLAAKDGTLNDPADDVAVFKYDGTPTSFPTDYKRGDPLESGTYTVHTDPTLALPYLPDPLSVGLCLQGFPGAPAIVREFAGAGDWPNYESFTFDLVGTSGPAPELGPLPSFTSIALPKGTMLTLKCSSAITDGGRGTLARWHKFDNAMKHEVANLKNQHWMITPGRSVTFVHAVEKPLDVPLLQRFSFNKAEGHTFVRVLRSEFGCPSHSTGQIELFARWKDKVDRLEEQEPRYEDRAGRIYDLKVGYEEATVRFGDGTPGRTPVVHEFGDTKHRMVEYYGVGTTRYREYFPASITSNPSLISVEGPPYEPTPGVKVVNIPSSAHPDVPKVLYILPTFKWIDTPNGRQRVGRGLRIYLDRPWFSSGDNELLGIVVPRAQQPIGEEVRRYISEWGADPLYSSTGPLQPIGLSSFVADPEAPEFTPVLGQNLRLNERTNQDLRADVIGVAPAFNLDRKVHFVDVTMAPGAAFQPFVRFSLVRYQPSSLPGLHLSRSVRTEFAQLMADRTATFTRGRSGLEVTLSGLASRNSLGQGLPSPDPIPIPIQTGPGQSRQGLSAPATGPVTDPGIGLPGPITDPGIQIVKDAYAGAGRLVVASFERLDMPASDDLGWKATAGEWILESYKSLITPEYVFWKRTVPLPAGLGTDGKQYRLLIKEYEIFATDPEVAETVPVFNPGSIPLKKRLVYADRFDLEP